MTILPYALEAFLALMSVLIGSNVVGEVVHLYNEKQSNETFRTAIDQMTKSTITAIESMKDTITLGANVLANMTVLTDVNSLAQKKVEQAQNSQNQQTK